MKGYSIDKMPEKHARAQVKETDISLKDAVNVAHFIRNMDLEAAKNALNLVVEKKMAVPYFRYLDSVSHRKGIGPGRYPVKAVKSFQKLLDDVSANAEFKGLTDDLKIFHISASKGRMIKKFTPKAYGRAGANFKDLINLDIVVIENEKE
ncbi:50S ribosomal protein L22P [Ferroplasma acidiphilum]|jgi:large subunit ribosomal protein L22|uniref:Large ribosomal subunit protein uL22 n=2 Tax=Ferroplasma TaxID=74968 RepID=S0ASV6_FERAC|nr:MULTISPECIES: 50S ribosomal protein L22 [Ferroplasma]AGO61119.1 50S ribosomal protein L22P [Ferroplasma acidarmanus Fer1]ARD84093.1 50S ribosomal protein L22P [Ferroplasma acidiphilum]MCL4348746.1 50S ribosomal protein L22 [Candidatus Thermoplasmatota archaeon]WMT52993.1 MAG: 50S ribosomal protein L22 [Ferroplasma acidiphilum]